MKLVMRTWTDRELRALSGEEVAPLTFTRRREVRARKRHNKARRAMLRHTRTWWPGLWALYSCQERHARAYISQRYGAVRWLLVRDHGR